MSLEHVNMWVEDIGRKTKFLLSAFPTWTIRGEDLCVGLHTTHCRSSAALPPVSLRSATGAAARPRIRCGGTSAPAGFTSR